MRQCETHLVKRKAKKRKKKDQTSNILRDLHPRIKNVNYINVLVRKGSWTGIALN